MSQSRTTSSVRCYWSCDSTLHPRSHVIKHAAHLDGALLVQSVAIASVCRYVFQAHIERSFGEKKVFIFSCTRLPIVLPRSCVVSERQAISSLNAQRAIGKVSAPPEPADGVVLASAPWRIFLRWYRFPYRDTLPPFKKFAHACPRVPYA